MRQFQVFMQITIYIAGACCLLLSVISCTPSDELDSVDHHCGSGNAPSQLNGLFWLLGEPTSANVLCSVQNSEFKQVYVLEPDSRDPLLFDDELTGRTLLIERFSGQKARLSRATWFSPEGVQLSQFGDWPQNTYAALRLSDDEGLATGFDFGQVRRFLMSRNSDASLGRLSESEMSFSSFNPIVTLHNGSWLALIASGFDLKTFSANEAQVMRVSDGSLHPDGLVSIADATQGVQCKNAFQTLQLSNAQVILSCNPQYFGPDAKEVVAVFDVELMSNGELKIRKLHSESGSDVQRIDLLGQLNRQEVLLGMKVTTTDDYTGKFVRSAIVSPEDLQLRDRDDARGPTTKTKLGNRVTYCVETSLLCKQDEFLLSEMDGSSASNVNPSFSLPFLSFPSRINAP